MKGLVATVTLQHYPHGLRCRHSKGEGSKGDPGSRPTVPMAPRWAKPRQSQDGLLTVRVVGAAAAPGPRGHLNNSQKPCPLSPFQSHWESRRPIDSLE